MKSIEILFTLLFHVDLVLLSERKFLFDVIAVNHVYLMNLFACIDHLCHDFHVNDIHRHPNHHFHCNHYNDLIFHDDYYSNCLMNDLYMMNYNYVKMEHVNCHDEYLWYSVFFEYFHVFLVNQQKIKIYY